MKTVLINMTSKDAQRFWARVEVGRENECWLDKHGKGRYGSFWLNGKSYGSHVIAFALAGNTLEEGHHVQHHCGNPRCCNEKHMYAARPRETTYFTLESVFKKHVVILEGPNACHKWIGSLCGGYGVIRFQGKLKKAHHASYFLRHRKWPKYDSTHSVLRHMCENSWCVNSDHLQIGTQAENIRQAKESGRIASGARHGTHTKPDTVAKGEQSWNAKLTEGQVVQIRRTHEAFKRKRGLMASLVRHYGLDGSTIAAIIERKSWDSVPQAAHPEIQPLGAEFLFTENKKGEDSVFSKVTDQQIREIRFLYHQAGGKYGSQSRLAKRYLISISQLHRIVNGESRPEAGTLPEDFQGLPPLF